MRGIEIRPNCDEIVSYDYSSNRIPHPIASINVILNPHANSSAFLYSNVLCDTYGLPVFYTHCFPYSHTYQHTNAHPNLYPYCHPHAYHNPHVHICLSKVYRADAG
jgi:hypothetical protein